MKQDVSININGQDYEGYVENRMLLVDFIRDVADLTGTHVGCTYEGTCGACTIQLDDEPVKSCLLLAVQGNGRKVTTVEGLANDGVPSLLQDAFNDEHGLQCGYCTRGILTNMDAFLRENPNPSEAEIREALVGNLCRCTGYVNIVKAVLTAAAKLKQMA